MFQFDPSQNLGSSASALRVTVNSLGHEGSFLCSCRGLWDLASSQKPKKWISTNNDAS